MNLLELAAKVHNKETAVEFMKEKRLIHGKRLCTNAHKMTLKLDENMWYCCLPGCRMSIDLRKDTFLENSELEFHTVIRFIYFWSVHMATADDYSRELSMSAESSTKWCNLMIKVLTWKIKSDDNIIGGPGLNVEVDETLFKKSGICEVSV